MDFNIFTDKKFGECVEGVYYRKLKPINTSSMLERIKKGEELVSEIKYNYFIPNNLPPKISFNNTIILLLENANKYLGELNGLLEHSIHNELLWNCYIVRESAYSSQIEGTISTIEDYWLSENDKPDIHKDVQDIRNYIKTLEYGFNEIKENRIINNEIIFNLHKYLFSGNNHYLIGKITNNQNFVRGNNLENAFFIFPHPDKKPQLLNDLIEYVNNSKSEESVLIKCALIHYQFEAIHPFIDGNGRIGRILIILFLCYTNFLKKPLLNLSNYFYNNKDEYMERLLNVSIRGEWEEWIIFFLNGIISQSKIAIEEAKELISLYNAFVQKMINNKIQNQITTVLLNAVFNNPILNISKLCKDFGYNYNTIKYNVMKLKNVGVLEKYNDKDRDNLYYCPEIMNILLRKGYDEELFVTL